MMDLITGHQGVAHISAVQVATLNNKLTGDIGEHKVMRITGGTVTKNGLTLEIATGYWRVNGYDMEITEAETVYFDPSTVGLKRIDGVYVEILRDIASGVERAEIIVVKGEEGVSPVAPSAPTAPEYTTDILHQCELVGEVEVNENTMTLTDATIEYKISSGGAESLAPQFDENTSYSVGDVVEYDGKLYVFTSAHTGAWNASHVSETTVNALLANKADIPVSISQGGTGSTTAPQARSNLGAASDTTVGKIYNIIRQVSDDAYKTTKAYKAGDYVIHDDKLYKCTSACTAGSWATNSSHFTQDTLTNAVSQLNNDLSNVEDGLEWHEVEAVANGSASYSGLFDMIYSTLSNPATYKEAMMYVGNDIFYCMNKNTHSIFGSTSGAGNVNITSIRLVSSGSSFTNGTISSSGASSTDWSNLKPSSGTKIIYRYRL